MNTSSCPTCGAVLAADLPPGLCPYCLFGDVLELDTQGSEASAGGEGVGPARDSGPPERVGDYALLDEIGRGGMGIVYRARQEGLNRIVALKVMVRGARASGEDRRRFLREAESAAQLQHPNIVPVHDVGDCGGQLYFSMEYVPGPTLAQLVRERPLAARVAAGYVKVVAEAVGYAHRRGLLHRDLKPSNILVGEDGRPRITDFGLARLANAESDLTVTGATLGTPAYLPPEQASVRRGAVGAWSDVYSLGAVLYHLLTGRPPFLAESVADILQQVLTVEPVPLRRLDPSIPRDLETICLKCLDKVPSRRYAGAAALAEDLDRWLTGRTILARPAGMALRAARWTRRHPAVASALVLGVLVLGFGVAWAWQRQDTRREQALAREAALQAIHTRRLAQIQTAEMRDARGEHPHLLLALSRILREAGTNTAELGLPSTRLALDRLMSLLSTRTHLVPAVEPVLYALEAGTLALSPRGDRLAVAAVDSTVRLWRVGEPDAAGVPLKHPGRIRWVEFGPEGAWLATHGHDETTRLWDVARPEAPRWARTQGAPVRSLGFLADPAGVRVVTADEREVVVRDVASGDEVFRWGGFPTALTAAFPMPDGAGLVVLARGGEVGLRSRAEGGEQRWELDLPADAGAGALSPDGRYLAVAAGSEVRVVALTPGEAFVRRLLHEAGVERLAWCPTGLRLATATSAFLRREENAVRVWDVATAEMVAGPMRHAAGIQDVSFSPHGRWLVSASADHTARVWDVRTGRPLTEPMSHAGEVVSARFTPGGGEVVTLSVHDLVTWRVLLDGASPMVWPEASPVKAFDLSADGRLLVAVLADHRVVVADVATGERIVAPLEHSAPVVYAGFAGDAGQVVTLAADRVMRLWSVADGRMPGELAVGDEVPSRVQAGGDGRVLALAGVGGKVRVVEVRDGVRLMSVIDVGEALAGLQVSPDGRTLAGVTRMGALRLWATRDGGLIGDRESELPPKWIPLGSTVLREYARMVAEDGRGGFLLEQAAPGAPAVPVPDPAKASLPGAASDEMKQWLDAYLNKGLGEDVQQASGVRVEPGRGFETIFRTGTVPWTWNCRFSPDSRRVAASTAWGTVQVWDATETSSGSRRATREFAHGANAGAIAFSPDGARLASGGEDGSVRVWEVATGLLVADILAHDRGVWGVGFSPEGRRVFSLSMEGEMRIWDALTGSPVSDPLPHPATVRKAVFTADGQRLVTLDYQGRLSFWDLVSVEPGAPRWLTRMTEVLAGREDSGGREKGLYPSDLWAVRRQRTLTPGTNLLARWAEWYFNSGRDRSLSFFGGATREAEVARAMREDTEAALGRALGLDPTHPGILARLAVRAAATPTVSPARARAEARAYLGVAERLDPAHPEVVRARALLDEATARER